MTEFFKSALGGIIGTGTGTNQGNDFVGQFVELGNQKLRVKRVIAEGGYAFVFVTQDVTSGKEFALKRLLANEKEKNKAILQEIQYLKKLSGHPNIIQFISAAGIDKEQSDHGQSEYLILTELCCGQLVEELNKQNRALPSDTVLQIFYQSCAAVQHMHKQDPPIIHRDLKAENLLFTAKGAIKLCDFGSATTAIHNPDSSWSAIQRSLVEDEITRNTTPMYRSPEMLDLYQNYPINQACDIWALGCLLFKLCFVEHPFEDSAKLRIINANYVIPDTDTEYELFHDLIRGMLTVNPEKRPTINDVLDRLREIAEARNINPRQPLPFAAKMANNSYSEPPNRSSYSQPSSQPSESSFGTAGSLFNSLKGGAGSVFKNIKDASSKVMETVSNTINKGDLDVSCLTSRILVMSYPAEGMESAIKNNIEDVRAYLENRHRGSYAVYNLSQRSYRVARFENRVSECGWPAKKAPPLTNLYAICKNMHLWLRQKPRNVCVVHCLDGKSNSACVVGAFMMFCRLFDNSAAAMHLFTARRSQPGITASQARYINYIGQMVSDQPVMPHSHPVLLKSMSMRPLPMFNKMKNGCTPFVEIYIGEDRVLSTSQEYERMCQFTNDDGAAVIPLNTSVCGDVTIIAYHARSTFGGKIQGKITSMKIFQVQFHTGFIEEGTTNVQFHQYDLDQLDTADKYPDSFTVTFDLLVSPKGKSPDRKFPWENFPVDKLTPKILFSTKEEVHQIFSEYGVSDRAKSRMSRASSFDSSPAESPTKRQAEPQSSPQNQAEQRETDKSSGVGKSSFFDTLDWQDQNTVKTPDQPASQPTESEMGLLNNDSDDEGNFANFSQQGSNGGVPHGYGLIDDDDAGKSQPSSTKPSGFFDAQFEEQNTNSSSDPEVVDLLNINSPKPGPTQTVTEGVDLLNIGGDPSSVDLLSGHSSAKAVPNAAKNGQEPDLLGMSGEDTFDPFKQFTQTRSSGPTSTTQPDLMTSNNPPSNNDTFDPFQSFGSSTQSTPAAASGIKVTPPQQTTAGGLDDDFFAFMEGGSSSKEKSNEPDLMTGWDTNNIQAFSNQAAAPTNNLKPASGGIHKSASTGSAMNFQSMMGNQGSPSFNNMGGRNSPSMSSGMGGMGGRNSPSMSSGMGSGNNFGAVPKADPFADLGGLGKTSFTSSGQQKTQAPTMKPSPAGMQGWGPSPQASFGTKPQPQHSSPQHHPHPQQQQQQAFPKANYSSSVIGDREERGARKAFVSGGATNPANNSTKRGVMDDTLDELLKGHKFNPKKDEPKTLGGMRKKQLVEEMDPDKLKIMEWTTGKEKNIRALICSLGQILWDGEARWRPVGMHELVSADQVKKWWRKAVLCIHPDKLTDDPNQPLARLIFMELNDAWGKFEEEGSKSLY